MTFLFHVTLDVFRICSYFVQGSLFYTEFAREASKIFENDLDPTSAVRLIMEHRTKVLKLEADVPVFVFVDEFRKLHEACVQEQQYREQDLSVLSSLGNFLDQPLKHTVMISTLENTVLNENGSLDVELPVLTYVGI